MTFAEYLKSEDRELSGFLISARRSIDADLFPEISTWQALHVFLRDSNIRKADVPTATALFAAYQLKVSL